MHVYRILDLFLSSKCCLTSVFKECIHISTWLFHQFFFDFKYKHNSAVHSVLVLGAFLQNICGGCGVPHVNHNHNVNVFYLYSTADADLYIVVPKSTFEHTWVGHWFTLTWHIPWTYLGFVQYLFMYEADRKVSKQVSSAVLLCTCDLHEKFGGVVMQCFAHLSHQLRVSSYSTAFHKE